jgi:membrane-associated phospholipid phosphatase
MFSAGLRLQDPPCEHPDSRLVRAARDEPPQNPQNADPTARKISDFRSLRNAAVFSLLFLGTTVVALYPDWFDRPVAKAINNLTIDHQFANVLASGIAYPTLQGVTVVALVWGCWFSALTPDLRARLMSGAMAAILAAIIAHLVQRGIPTSPKPIFDPFLHLDPSAVLGDIDGLKATALPSSHTFPSERGTMFAGLAIAVFLVRPTIGLLALACTTAAEVSRIHLGLHYPIDIFGSFSLAAATVWLAQMRWSSKLGFRLIRWELASPSTFYICAYLASYGTSTAFQDLRDLSGRLLQQHSAAVGHLHFGLPLDRNPPENVGLSTEPGIRR